MTSMQPNLTVRNPPTKFEGTKALGLAATIINQVKARKTRETENTINTFVQHSKGLQEAQGQIQQAQQMMQTAMQKLQANPEDQEARQALIQGSQITKRAREALNIAQTNLKDMFTGPKADKHTKMLERAFGIDDKNAQTPERAAAIKAIQKAQGVDEKTAAMMSNLPQRQQLGPQASQQAQLQHAGAVGKPATGGQVLAAQGKKVDQAIKVEKLLHETDADTEKIVQHMRKDLGLVPEKDDKGNIVRNPDGQMKTKNLEPSEMSAEEFARYQDVKAQTDLRVAQEKAVPVRALAAQLNSQANMQRARQAQSPGFVQAWAKALQDPTQKVTLGNVPSQARGAVLAEINRQGGKVAIPLTGKEVDRMDLATSAIFNIEEAQKILDRRPDMFGPGGYAGTKFKMLASGGDPDARSFQARMSLANLPAIGIHGVRGKWALQDISNLDSNLYTNAESMREVLNDIHSSAAKFRDVAGRPESIHGTAGGGAGETKMYQGHQYHRSGPGQPWTMAQ